MALAWLALRGRRGRRAAVVPALALAVACAVPIGLYATWFRAAHGRFALTSTEKVFLYGRTAAFADCGAIRPRPALARLCPRTPPEDVSPAYAALWTDRSPFAAMPGGKAGGNRIAGEFAWAAIRAQPLDYLRIVVRDTARAFAWSRTVYPSPWTFAKYEFPARERRLNARQAKVARPYAGAAGTRPVIEPYARWMRAYQRGAYLPGTVLGVLLLAAAAGIVRGRRNGAASRAVLPWTVSFGLLVVPAATADFDYRYVLPAFPFGALAVALAFVPSRRSAAPPAADQEPDRQEEQHHGPDRRNGPLGDRGTRDLQEVDSVVVLPPPQRRDGS
ncbi:hypothetical protein ACFQHO_17070 [Actinomadura yumaensis]|uniref:hypothetical protein n=1 Tax=Actinomadura yumaensis TaxID=111807 RepID=UPI00361508C5